MDVRGSECATCLLELHRAHSIIIVTTKSHRQAGSLLNSILQSKFWLNVQRLDLTAPTDKVLQLYTGWP